jgi:hypothetical protein
VTGGRYTRVLIGIWLLHAMRGPPPSRSPAGAKAFGDSDSAPYGVGEGAASRAGFLWKHLDPSDRWQHRLTTLGLIIAVAGFTFVALQLRETRRTVSASAWATMSSQLLDFDKALVDDPAAANYLGGSAKPKNAEDELKAWQLAVMQLDLWDAWNGQQDFVFQLDRQSVDDWKTDLYGRSPLLCRVLAETAGYPDEFRKDGYQRCGDRWPSDVPAP